MNYGSHVSFLKFLIPTARNEKKPNPSLYCRAVMILQATVLSNMPQISSCLNSQVANESERRVLHLNSLLFPEVNNFIFPRTPE